MKVRALLLGTTLSVVMAANANATIVGSTYDYTFSSTGSGPYATQIASGSGLTGTATDPSNPGFCVTSLFSGNNCTTGGLAGSFSFANVSPTQDTITFTFYGSTTTASGSFSIDLGNFVTTDGETITGVTYASGNLSSGSFTSVSWNGTDAVFTGTPVGLYGAYGGRSISFNVATTGPTKVPEPSTLSLFGAALLAFGGFEWTRRRRRRGRTGSSGDDAAFG